MPETVEAVNSSSIVIIDDHPIVRDGLSDLLNNHERFEVIGEADSYAQAIKTVKKCKPDLAIIDITLPDINGLELIKHIHQQHPKIKILVMSMHDESVYGMRAIEAGASGYLMKQQSAIHITEAVDCVLEGRSYISENLKTMLKEETGHSSSNIRTAMLTNRELAIFELIAQGIKTNEIADKLGISAKTVSAHREHIKSKLGIAHSNQLIQKATEWMIEINRPN